MENNSLLFNLADPLCKKIYTHTLTFPRIYQSSIGDQLRRSILSVVLNIVEGGARSHIGEKKQFRNIAFGSLKESKYLIGFAKDQKLIDENTYFIFLRGTDKLARVMYGLMRKDIHT